MKKRMFITTIVMMLVLAVALTTSSLAWFSSANTAVTASAATFTAQAAEGNVNLKIGDTTGAWSNQIALTDGSGTTMIGLIPQNPLVATYENSKYVWPAKIAFNTAKIAEYSRVDVENDPVTSRFIIDADATGADLDGDTVTQNQVADYQGLAKNSSAGYYYDEFFIHNADAQTSISSLKFQVQSGSANPILSTLGSEGSDYTCNAYAAFILFDAIEVEVGNPVPGNALEAAGYTVVASTANPGDNEVKATSGTKYTAWIPFAAFTLVVDKTGDTGSNNSNVAWQFANLDEYDNVNDKFIYNGIDITNLNTQAFDGVSGETGYTLNGTNLKLLNDKVVNGQGNVTNSNPQRDNSSTFSMAAGETYRVAFYFWLDGYSMTEFTDTTVATVGIKISAS